ncbi:unnamed protein product [Candidula unifasciata]|uniref:Major facilitator superfamily (MFS) profile domain-containing protein n=1 Tax=Candidula unifasciata TaxID=100452 RepID=A0A8S3ZN19_9EUPU|nr:unnamed protein product [Candidula unifasciata]
MVFIGAVPDFHCRLSQYNLSGTSLHNLSYRQLKRLVIPKGEKCFQLNVTLEELTIIELDYNASSSNVWNKTNRLTPCVNGYEFSRVDYQDTITSEFDLVCNNKFWISTSKSVFFVGRLVGAVIFGQLSDRYGRRPMFFLGCILLVIAGTLASFAPNMYVFLPAYFCQGAAHTGAFLVSYTLSTELVGPNYRTLAGFVIQGFYSIGFMSLAGIAYFVRDWRYLEMAITAPTLLFGIYWWFLPESVRWLISHGKDAEAEDILRAAAKENGVTLNSDIIESLKHAQPVTEGRQYYFLDLVNNWKMARLSLNIWFNWLVNALVYYGLSLNTGNLAGDPYLNFCIAGAVEIPAYALCIAFLNKVGRRWPLVLSMYLGGLACILSGCIPVNGSRGVETLTVILAMIGKFGITASYGIIYLMAAEIFPTVTRNIGMGVASMSARIGGILAPFFLDLKTVSEALPLILFGGLSLLAGSLALMLPETAGKPLPQLPEDVDTGISGRFVSYLWRFISL